MEEDKYEQLQTLLLKSTFTNHYYDQTLGIVCANLEEDAKGSQLL